METATTVSFSYAVQIADTPNQVVDMVLMPTDEDIQLVFVDLVQLEWSAAQAGQFVEEFIEVYEQECIKRGQPGLAPPIAVLGDLLTLEDQKVLREAGAAVYDRSIADAPGNAESLLERLSENQGDNALSQNAPVSKAADTEEDTEDAAGAYDGYPAGVSAEDVANWIESASRVNANVSDNQMGTVVNANSSVPTRARQASPDTQQAIATHSEQGFKPDERGRTRQAEGRGRIR